MKSGRVLLAGILVLSLGAIAQDRPNFSGNWVLDIGKSEFGEFPVPDSQTNLIEHKDPNIKVTQTVRGEAVPGGQALIERHYTTDGKERVNRLGEQDAKSTAQWDGNKLVIETKVETPDGTIEIKDSWELSNGGKQLVVSRNFNGDRQRLLFNKQP